MRTVLKAVSAAALLGTILPPFLYLRGGVELDTMQTWMALATAAWFAATPWWMREG